MASDDETFHLEDEVVLTREQRQQNVGLYRVLREFIYNFEFLDLSKEQTDNITSQSIDHYINRNDDYYFERLEEVAEALMNNNPQPDSIERQIRRLDVVGYLIERDFRTLTTNDMISDMSESDNNDNNYDSDATTDQIEIDPNEVLTSLIEEVDDDATQEQIGGKLRNKLKGILPQLKPVTMKNKKYTYKLNDPPSLRHKAIDEGIRYENKYMNKTKKQAAISKKGRFNILRIYRRNNNLKECKILTKDMEYMDKKYKLGKTSKICVKKNTTRKRKISKKTTKKKRIKKSRRKR